jgi:hypothetical protein
MSDSKETIGNAIDQLDLLHRLFLNHGDYGGVIPRALGIRDDLLVANLAVMSGTHSGT